MKSADRLSKYDVIWDSPSANANGSMPIGNGDLAANVWVEPNGDVLILVAKGDAWDENSSLLKLGRMRLRCDPPLPTSAPDGGERFAMRLCLRDAYIEVRAGDVTIRIRVDADCPTIFADVACASPRSVELVLETWRNYPYRIVTQTGDLFKNLTGKDLYPTIVTPDHVEAGLAGELIVYHENVPREHDAFSINLALQGLADVEPPLQSPLAGRVFGMAIRGDGFVSSGERSIRHDAALRHRIRIHALTMQPTTSTEWRAAMSDRIDADQSDAESRFEAHAAWWHEFWDRSYFKITSTKDAKSADDVTRAYVLQRYMNACAGRSAQPIKHNGSLFSVGRPWDPDFRRWGGPGFWFMNQRLIYWPMLVDGDFDLMRPWLKMYRDTLPLQKHRTRKYFGHAGAHFPETMTFWGAEVSAHYGWTPFEQRERPEAECAYLTYYWSGAVELILILSQFIEYAGPDAEIVESLNAIAPEVLTFYEQHYPRTADGTLRFEPAQALETWHKAVDPMPEIAGLRYLLANLLELPPGIASDALLAQARRILGTLPPLPTGERDGERVLLPAAEFDIKKNTENPELYCIFPYRLFGVGKPDLDLAERTFDRRLHVEHTCWHQDVIQMALLGRAEQAKDFVVRRASAECHSDSRFPAFWNAFHDWVPDIDHGGVLQLALQNMLVQCEGRQLRLLPAWPAEWDAAFKLRVPGPATIEGVVRGGKIEHFRIDPPDRHADVIVDLKDSASSANL